MSGRAARVMYEVPGYVFLLVQHAASSGGTWYERRSRNSIWIQEESGLSLKCAQLLLFTDRDTPGIYYITQT